jgi:hypothetical protein
MSNEQEYAANIPQQHEEAIRPPIDAKAKHTTEIRPPIDAKETEGKRGIDINEIGE